MSFSGSILKSCRFPSGASDSGSWRLSVLPGLNPGAARLGIIRTRSQIMRTGHECAGRIEDCTGKEYSGIGKELTIMATAACRGLIRAEFRRWPETTAVHLRRILPASSAPPRLRHQPAPPAPPEYPPAAERFQSAAAAQS